MILRHTLITTQAVVVSDQSCSVLGAIAGPNGASREVKLISSCAVLFQDLSKRNHKQVNIEAQCGLRSPFFPILPIKACRTAF
jgi:hypothetical protein